MKLYCFGLNYNFYDMEDEPYLTEINIPAENEEMARWKLSCLIGGVYMETKCRLNEIRNYKKP